MSFLTLFHSLLSNGTIPHDTYCISAWDGIRGLDDRNCRIETNDYVSSCIQKLILSKTPVEGASVDLCNLMRKFEIKYTKGAWTLTRVWISPLLSL